MNTKKYEKLTLVTVNGTPKLCYVETDRGDSDLKKKEVKLSWNNLDKAWSLPQDSALSFN